MTTSTHRYPVNALYGDYARAGLGLALTLGPAAMVGAGSGALYVLLPLALLFAVFALRTAARQIAVVELAADRVTLATWRRAALAWQDMHHLRVDYYSTRGDRAGGWMQLTAKGKGTAIRVDSAIEDFVAIARHAADAARANGVEISEATRANLGHLGIVIDA
jgi:hypothetical protein